MKYNQNSKIMQITEQTLVVGIDVASEVHYARAFDYRGIELGKYLNSIMIAMGLCSLSSGQKS